MEFDQGEPAPVDQGKSGDNDFLVKAPEVSLPKGGGAVRGIGEKFTANPVTGTGSLSIPIATSPGRAGFGPQLSLSYDSGAGNSPFGLGWNLSLPSITRKTDKGLPQYLDNEQSDVFILSGAEDLVPILIDDSGEWEDDAFTRVVDRTTYNIQRYRPRVEGLFARIEKWTNSDDINDCFWRSITRDNITSWYGKTSESRITDPATPAHIFSWLICESHDDKGNVVTYAYKQEDSLGINLFQTHERNRSELSRSAKRYIRSIKYGNKTPKFALIEEDQFETPGEQVNAESDQGWCFEALFDYGEHETVNPTPGDGGTWIVRNDPYSSHRAGFEVRTYRLCQRVLMFHHFLADDVEADAKDFGENYLVRSTDFNYRHQQDDDDLRNAIHSVLTSVTQSGYRKKDDGSYIKRSIPPVEFEYSPAELGTEIKTIEPESLENLPGGVDGTNYQWLDLNGEGLTGILTEQAGSWFYKSNESPSTRDTVGEEDVFTAKFAATNVENEIPAGALAGGARQFLDLAGNGKLDLVQFARPLQGFYERTHDEGWHTFQAFKQNPNINWQDPNLKFFDLTGDGHADIIISEEKAFTWYPSLGEEGFAAANQNSIPGDEEQGPKVIFADAKQSIFQTDFSGDGLTDIARIRNGEVCYWPNLGYGRFGAKVTMDNAPTFDTPEEFNPRRIRLADIDGSGVTDIIYLGRNTTSIWFNQSGNAWGDLQTIDIYPAVDNLTSVAAVDLLANGTACLVWSSPLPGDAQTPMRYIELMAQGKPHLLTKTTNNLGAETEIKYIPSTYFYLKDKQAGTPWVTKLPFPVHVVEKLIVKDKWRNTRFATSYSYHHGYFDGVEREFRGFGRVEQVDIESFGEFSSGNLNSPYIAGDHTLYQPPVKTITWYHTGASLEHRNILDHYQDEYFPNWYEALNPAETNVLGTFSEHDIPEPDLSLLSLNENEHREALRACKGMVLRQEIYELDVDAHELGNHEPVKLFSTAYHNCDLQLLQPQENNQHAVFLVSESEAITYNYELDLTEETLTPDPRISHTLNLTIDEYANVLQSVAVVYPRIGRHEDPTLPLGAEDLINEVQAERHLAYSETDYTNDVLDPDNYRLRLPCEATTYELTGIEPDNPTGSMYFGLDALRRYALNTGFQPAGVPVSRIAYHEIPDRTSEQMRIVEHVRMLYFDADLNNPLPFGGLNKLALPYETYKIALTADLLEAVFEDKITGDIRRDLDNPNISGYLSGAQLESYFGTTTEQQYWIRSGIAGFADDAADHFYLPEEFTDAFNQTTTLSYDKRDLYIKSSTGPAPSSNTTSVTKFNFRVLAACESEDRNKNNVEVLFDALGLPIASAIRGKGSEADRLDDLTDSLIDLDPTIRVDFFNDDVDAVEARRFLSGATTRNIYGFGESIQPDGTISYASRPASAAAIVREQHTLDNSALQVAFEYSDGSGNVLVTKTQAEPETEGGPLRWIASGKTILNNKGKAVKQYEPYFSTNVAGLPNHRFEEPEEMGVTPIMYYDAPGRLIRTELPDGSFSRVEFTSWYATSFDQNDTVLDVGNSWFTDRTSGPLATPENQRAARLAAEHANTPASVYLDSLGREVVSVAHNRVKDASGSLQDEKYVTFTKLDTEGKPLWIRDARNNLVMQYISPPVANDLPVDPTGGYVPCYDIAGYLLFQHSMDAGDRWVLMDATGQPFYVWDENTRITADGTSIDENRIYLTSYDELRRPLDQKLKVNLDSWKTIERFVYGEGKTDDEKHNLRGQVYQHYDQSGLVTNEHYDFKGNLRLVKRRLTSKYESAVLDWPEDPPNNYFEEETHTQITEHDALNRMTRLYNWHYTDDRVAVYEPQYNERGVLKSEDLIVRAIKAPTGDVEPAYSLGPNTKTIHAIGKITYNEKGQRLSIKYGNNTTTRYTYDEKTFRLTNLITTRSTVTNKLQHLKYTYDAFSNITEIKDDAQQTVYFRNTAVRPDCKYEYDSLYRLIKASGREHAVQNNVQRDATSFEPMQSIPFTNSPEALQRYTEEYTYDSVGNVLNLAHSGGTELRWKRCYQYAQDSNRLIATGKPGDMPTPATSCPAHYAEISSPQLSQHYSYDTHGSMLAYDRTPDEYRLHWDYRDMIHRANLGGGGNAWYNYDKGKQRTRKHIIRNGGAKEERFYLGGMEVYKRKDTNGNLKEKIETHHLFADDQHVLIVEDVLETDNANLSKGVLQRYQYGNHLGSASLEADIDANTISYEEYHPYGTTAYQAENAEIKSANKRYRYTGMERDEETGLSYHTARCYLPWLGRWGNADPVGLKGGMNLYGYVEGRVVNSLDTTGKQAMLNPGGGRIEEPHHFDSFEEYVYNNPELSEEHLFEQWRLYHHERYEALEQRVRNSAREGVEVIRLSSSDIDTIVEEMLYQGSEHEEEGIDYAVAMSEEADSFLREGDYDDDDKLGLSSLMFEYNGDNYLGGQINYLAVGAYNTAYIGNEGQEDWLLGLNIGAALLTLPIGFYFGLIYVNTDNLDDVPNEILTESATVVWNYLQFLKGLRIHNITDIPDNRFWAEEGVNRSFRFQTNIDQVIQSRGNSE